MAVTNLATVGTDTTISSGTIVVGSGTANTKGPYVEMTASTPFAVTGVILQVTYAGSGILSNNFLFDIATGGAGSETPIVENIAVTAIGVRGGYTPVFIPIAIPSGSRISVRCQNSSTSTTGVLGVGLILVGGTAAGASSCQTYGANTATSRGTSVDPGGSANTKGPYVELTSATTADANYLVLMFTRAAQALSESVNWLIDIATGGPGAESVLIADVQVAGSITGDRVLPTSIALAVPTISSGTRLSARAACSVTSGARVVDVSVLALNVPEPASGGGAFAYAFMG